MQASSSRAAEDSRGLLRSANFEGDHQLEDDQFSLKAIISLQP